MAHYWDYLKLDQLLTLQSGFDAEPGDDVESADELHFIVVHQVYELWFKLVLRELRLARNWLAQPRVAEETVPNVVHHLRRVSTVLQMAVQHWRLVETLTPQDFLAFRDKLIPASGFQSFQLRELEIVMGLEESQRISYGKVRPIEHIEELGKGTSGGEFAIKAVQKARSEQTFLASLNEWLYRTPIQGSSPDHADDAEVVRGFLEDYLAKSVAMQDAVRDRIVAALGDKARGELEERTAATRKAAREFLFAEDVAEEDRPRALRIRAAALFIESYRDLPLLAWPRLLLDAVVEMEEQVLHFRNAHARMVERVIGRRVGTGGSGGVDYLDKTMAYRVFRDLWTVRSVLLPKDRLPTLQEAEFYGFAVE